MRIAADLVVCALAVGLAWACHKAPDTPASAGKKQAAPAEAETRGAPAETGAAEPGKKAAQARQVDKSGVVDGRKDPPWFRPGLVDGTTVSRQSRSVENQSMMLLEFEPGTTAEDCIAKVSEKLEPHVSLTSAPGTGKPGQISVSGSTPEYRATVVCGEAKGKMRAYIGYQWLK